MNAGKIELAPKVPDAWKRGLYLVTFSVWFIYKQLLLGNIPVFALYMESMSSRLDQVCAGALILQILFLRRYDWKEGLVTLGLTAVFGTSAYLSNNWIVLMAWLFIAGAAGADLDEVLRAAYIILVATAAAIIGLCLAGMIRDSVVLREGLERRAMGYQHPNVLGMILQEIAALQIYVRRKKLTPLEPIVCILGAVFVNMVPNSRASVITMILLLILTGYVLIAPKLPKVLRRAVLVLCAVVPVLCNLASVVITLACRDTVLFTVVNDLLSGRLAYPYYTYQVFGVSVWGNFIPIVNGEPVVIDNSFLLLLLNFGLVSYLCYSLLHAVSAWRLAQTGNELLVGINAIFAIHALAEKSLLDLRFNVFLLAAAIAVFRDSPCEASIRKRPRKRKKLHLPPEDK